MRAQSKHLGQESTSSNDYVFEMFEAGVDKSGFQRSSLVFEGGGDGVGTGPRDTFIILEQLHWPSKILFQSIRTCRPAFKEFPWFLSINDGISYA